MTEKDEDKDEDFLEEDENSEESSDIDQRQEVKDELTYAEKLEAWFTELSKEYPIEMVNKMRERVALSQQLKYYLTLNEMSQEAQERGLRLLDACEERDNALFEQIKALIEKESRQSDRLQLRMREVLEIAEKRNKELTEKMSKYIEDAEKRGIALDEQTERLGNEVEKNVLLRRKKLEAKE